MSTQDLSVLKGKKSWILSETLERGHRMRVESWAIVDGFNDRLVPVPRKKLIFFTIP
jgi:hypothetical protein